jgi:voltage-gated sodium channel
MFSKELKQAKWQLKIEAYLGQPFLQHSIVVLIFINALLLGMETSDSLMARFGDLLHLIDHFILGVFIAELALLMVARGFHFFTDPWCVFDFLVIAIALVPASESLSVLRSLRVLRVLRLINKVESMKKVVRGLLGSLTSLGSVMGLMLIVFYVSAVVSTNLFGKDFPDYFGNLGATFFTLFQVMTLESWSASVARPIMETFPSAWIFFVIFIMISTFVVINLFVAAIVDSFGNQSDPAVEERKRQEYEAEQLMKEHKLISQINEEFIAIQAELKEVKEIVSLLAKQNKA